jgi:5-(carboxyamino)imidazole ribonucleotide mutase
MSQPLVGIVMGSESDRPAMEAAGTVLGELGVPFEMQVMSAHRTPAKVAAYAEGAAERGIRVLVAGAGMAAHLAGAVAARTILPVIGVPLEGSPLLGLDALLATVQMPPGIPVATVAVGKAGAKNAGFLAAQILALSDPDLARRLRDRRGGWGPGVLLAVDPTHPDPRTIEIAAVLLRKGEVVAGPSDTVYGFLALAGNPRGLATLRRLKGRDGPFLVVVATWEEARSLSPRTGPGTWNRLSRVWPGPVTAVLPAGAPGSGETVAMRMPDSALLAALVTGAGGPLLSTSANPPGGPTPLRAGDVLRAFPEGIPLVLDGGDARSSEPSTLVDLCVSPPRVIRPGGDDPGPLLDPRPLPP